MPEDHDYLFISKNNNPLNRNSGDNVLGDSVLSSETTRDSPFSEGTITGVYPDTYTVDVSTSNGIQSGCRILSTALPGDHGSGESCLPKRGTRCLILFCGGSCIVMGYLPQWGGTSTSADPIGLTCGTDGFGGDDPVYTSNGADDARQGRSREIVPGEWAMSATEGNLLAVLRGICLMKGSELSQIVVTQLGKLVRIVSGHFQHFHAAGETQIINKNGKTSITLKAAADQLSQNGGEASAYTIHMNIGAEGDLAEFYISEPDGVNILARLHVDSQGNVTVKTQQLSFDCFGDVSLKLHKNLEVTIAKDFAMTVTGAITTEYAKDFNQIIGGNYTSTVTGNTAFSSKGTWSHVVGGKKFETVIGDTDITNTGSVTQSVIAKPYKVAVTAGPIELSSMELTTEGDASLRAKKTALIDGTFVKLGGSTALDPVIRRSDLIIYSKALIALINAFSTVGLNTLGLPGAPLILPAGAPSPLDLAILALGSTKVRSV